MIKIYKGNETNFLHNGLGILKDAINAIVTEEQNGIFELEFNYNINSNLSDAIVNGSIVKADASPTLKNQLFRIYYVSKSLDGKIAVKAQHISYDLFDNFIENIDLNQVSCEYALNHIFKSCTQRNDFKGYSDIQNVQNYKLECVSAYEAIKGTRGSIVDTFGLGAKIKRDNFNIHVVNVRGESNNVLIAYRKNILGFESSVDIQDVVTKIYPFAMIDKEVGEGEDSSAEQVKITLSEKYIESENIGKYPNEKILAVDFTDDSIKNESQLRAKAKTYFNNKSDIPLTNYKVEFIELSKTENYKDYEVLEDVGLDDEIIVRDFRLGINATTRVVKTSYDPICKKYISIELGQLVNHFKNDDDRFDKIEDELGNIKDDINNISPDVDDTDFPDTLPDIPIVTANGLFATVQLEWTYENKMYYNYEVYASQIKGFEADTTGYSNRIYQGQSSAFLHEVKPTQTWFYKVRAGNTHNSYTDFSTEVEASTRKLSDAAEYFEEAAINHALIGSLDADKINVGKLKGTFIDAKDLSVTDGNGDKTLTVDSFGRVSIKATEFSLQGKSIDDISNEVAQGKIDAAKEQLDKDIQDVSDSVGSLKDYADTTLKDGILTESEKEGYKTHLKTLATEKADIDNNYKALYANADLVSVAMSNLTNAYNNYVSKYNDLITVITDILELEEITQEHRDSLENGFNEHDKTLATYATREQEALSYIAQRKANNAASSAVSGQSQLDIFNKLTNNGQTQGIYLNNGKLYLNASYMQTGTIACDMINSTNSGHPIIKLFGNCAIDATKLNEQGKGDAIRLKWDSLNYIRISSASTEMYSSQAGGTPIFRFTGSTEGCNIYSAPNRSLSFKADGLYTNNVKISVEGHKHDGVYKPNSYTPTWNEITSKPNTFDTTWNQVSGKPSSFNPSSHNHSGNALTPDNVSPRTIGNGNSILMHSALDGNNKNLGWSGSKFGQVVAANGYFGNMYSSAIDNPVSTLEDKSLNDVIDDIIIESPNVVLKSDSANRLLVNVNKLKENINADLFVSYDDVGSAVVNESNLLALALMEIKSLKEEVINLKESMVMKQ